MLRQCQCTSEHMDRMAAFCILKADTSTLTSPDGKSRGTALLHRILPRCAPTSGVYIRKIDLSFPGQLLPPHRLLPQRSH